MAAAEALVVVGITIVLGVLVLCFLAWATGTPL
jgi:hypothetical protein